MLVCHTGGSYRNSFTAHWGVMQGKPLSSLIFNMVVDAVVIREWLRQTFDEEAASARSGLTIKQMAIPGCAFLFLVPLFSEPHFGGFPIPQETRSFLGGNYCPRSLNPSGTVWGIPF